MYKILQEMTELDKTYALMAQKVLAIQQKTHLQWLEHK